MSRFRRHGLFKVVTNNPGSSTSSSLLFGFSSKLLTFFYIAKWMFVFSFTLKVILRSTTDDEQFSVECRKWFGIALSLVDSAVWLVQNIRPTLLTNQITYWILPRPRHLCFLVPQEVCLFLLCSYRVLVIFFFILIEHRVLEWFFVFDTQSKSA